MSTMDTVILIGSWFVIVTSGIAVIVGLFTVGRSRLPTTTIDYIAFVIIRVVLVAIAGRCLGWW